MFSRAAEISAAKQLGLPEELTIIHAARAPRFLFDREDLAKKIVAFIRENEPFDLWDDIECQDMIEDILLQGTTSVLMREWLFFVGMGKMEDEGNNLHYGLVDLTEHIQSAREVSE